MRLKLSLALGGALALAACVGPGAPPAPPPGPPPPAATPAPAPAAPVANPTVGGATMYSSRNVAENVSAAPNLSTLMTAVRAAGLADTLSGTGPITVFAPTNDAFNRLAPGTIDTLLRPENRPALRRVLTYHILPGSITSAELRRRVQAGGGAAQLTTAAGQPLTARIESGVLTLTDTNGVTSYLETPDVRQSNGVVHIVNGVLAPRIP